MGIGIGAGMAIAGGAAAGGSIFSSIFGAAAQKQQAKAIQYSTDKAAETALNLDAKARADVRRFEKSASGRLSPCGTF